MTSGSLGRSRFISAGGDHAGRNRLLMMKDSPCHCFPARPTPTGWRSECRRCGEALIRVAPKQWEPAAALEER